jgi:predicted helicase
MTPADYLAALNRLHATGRAREHAYRGDLQQLLSTILPQGFTVVNEPSKVRNVGNPDYLIRNGNGVAVGYIEAKDIGKDLDDKAYREQFDRYRKGLDNLIITDYLRFDFYQSGERVHSATIGEFGGKTIAARGSEYDRFVNLIRDFGQFVNQSIRSPKRLAELMAGKARLLQDILFRAVTADLEAGNETELTQQFTTFRDVLIHDLEPRQFSDLYAQTLAYGLFAARLHDDSPDDFSRQEASELIPRSNPFLRQLFGYVAGFNIDSRIKPTVDNLADIFVYADVRNLMTGYGERTQMTDPVIHFYETFLAEYDPALRKARGVWYTPQPVVDFIVRTVDDILKVDFGLKDGLANSSKIKIKRKIATKKTADRRSKVRMEEIEEEVHRVQILDPATGTGTFLASVIKYVFERNFRMMPGAWPDYVEQHLIPRLNGFELLMASYAMAHLKLDLLLRETGYNRELAQRFRVYLTNSLEEDHPDTGTLFASFLSQEANEANRIKRETPVMCVIGNPPYSGISTNKGNWITGLIDDYKYVNGEHFGERKHWLNDDYVKFIRMSEELISRNGEGVLAFINNHSFLDNPTFRGMRWHLLQTFDEIYIVDLHGNSLKKEVAPDGSADVNVFDIQAGVSINIMVKRKGTQNELAKVHHLDLYGSRERKYGWLNTTQFKGIRWNNVEYAKQFYLFVPKNNSGRERFQSGFSVQELFVCSTSGIQTSRDFLSVDFDRNSLRDKVMSFVDQTQSDDVIRRKFYPNKKPGKYLVGDTRGWKLSTARINLSKAETDDYLQDYSYRPFDNRVIAYTSDLVDWTREAVLNHMLLDNVSITVGRQGQVTGDEMWNLLFCQTSLSDLNLFYRGGGVVFPLYLYPTSASELDFAPASVPEPQKRRPNLDEKLVDKIAASLGLRFTPEKEETSSTFAPIDLLDYIYAVLHDPDYRETYAEFLKIDFPRVPYPEDAERFWKLVRLGGALRRIHLLEHPLVDEPLVSYRGEGDNVVTRRLTSRSIGFELTDEDTNTGRVWINDGQYFDDVPSGAWEFYIGGYQPAQKWLKDRRDRKLSYDDIRHYCRIVRALMETERLMEELRGMVIE